MVIRRIDMATMAIQVTDTDIIRTDTAGHIGTMAIPAGADTTGTTGTEFTATTVITITIATNLAKDKDPLSWLGHRFEPAFFAKKSKRQSMISSFAIRFSRCLMPESSRQNQVWANPPKFGKRSPAAWMSITAKRFFVRAQMTPKVTPLIARTTIE